MIDRAPALRARGKSLGSDSIVKQPTLRRPDRRGRAPLVRFPLPEKSEGSRAPTGAGADRATWWLFSRWSPPPDRRRGPAHDAGRRASRRPAAAFSLRRRAALSPMVQTGPSVVSQLLA